MLFSYSRLYQYIEAPNLTYFNRLYENSNYALEEIWVQNDGDADWTVYTEPEALHFTNRESSVDGGTVLIRVYNSLPNEEIDLETPVTVHTDGHSYTVPAGSSMITTLRTAAGRVSAAGPTHENTIPSSRESTAPGTTAEAAQSWLLAI